MRFPLSSLSLIMVATAAFAAASAQADVVLVSDGEAAARIVVDTRNAGGANDQELRSAGNWLAEAIQQATGAELPIVDAAGEGPTVIIARCDAYPDIAAQAGAASTSFDAYVVATQGDRLYLLGNTASGARYAVAHLLRHLGFRYYAPSPVWHVVPTLEDVIVDLNVTESPALLQRSVWYAYGFGGDKTMQANYKRWVEGNRLSAKRVVSTGHSYGNIVSRNTEAFEQHPEFYAMNEEGERPQPRSPNAAKFCVSNPQLVQLVIDDRIKLFEQQRERNPNAFMVSVDPSDGQGTCHCENCAALGTTTDRVFHLANAVARALREKHSDGWVGLYAYSSHRLPPTIDVEPNVYVQVAMGFNRTQYTLPQLVEKWSEKVEAVGLREYYGVEAWDWGLPGRLRGAQVDYHRRWIPYYAQRKVNAINAESNSNWGAQSLGLHVAAEMMWDPSVDVDQLIDEYFQLAFGKAAEPMRALQAKFDEAPSLRPTMLTPMFNDVAEAFQLAESPEVKRRVIDMMAYLEYVAQYRDFDLVANREPSRNDRYYDALLPLMQYAWQTRHRDMIHYYALARRLCNGLPKTDNRLDFYIGNKEQTPVWMAGEPLSDEQVIERFQQRRTELAGIDDPSVSFSRMFEAVNVPGEDAGSSRVIRTEEEGVVSFRDRLVGYLPVGAAQSIELLLQPVGRSVRVAFYQPNGTLIQEQTITDQDGYTPVTITFDRANDYRVEFKGKAKLKIAPDVPLMIEASIANPAWIDMSGPMYFYVPRATTQVVADGQPRLSLHVPGVQKRLDVTPAKHEPDREYVIVDVPEGAAGQVWHTSSLTRGRIMLINVPPLLSLHRHRIFVPREVAEGDRLTTAGNVDHE